MSKEDKELADESVEDSVQADPSGTTEVKIGFLVKDNPVRFKIQKGSLEEILTDLAKLYEIALEKEWEPLPQEVSPASATTPPAQEGSSSDKTPECPIHDAKMQVREGPYGKFYSCPTKLKDGSYCKQTAKVS